MQRLTLPPAPTPPYIVGAGLVSAMTYSLRSEFDERARAHGALCALALRMTTPENAPFDVRAVSPFHAELADEHELAFGRLRNRIDVRDKAGAIAEPAIWQSIYGKASHMPEGVRGASMAGVFSEATSLGLVGMDDRNFRRRAWGPSLPAMHLICSFRFAMRRAHEAGLEITLRDVLFNREFQNAVVVGSNFFLPHVIKCWPKIKTDELWLFQARTSDRDQQDSAA